MVKQMIDERRLAKRAKRILSIQYRCVKSRLKDADTNWHISTTYDMSIIGLAFLSDVVYQINDVLELQVVMSGVLDVYQGYGEVIRVEKKETGAFCLIAVKFVKHSETSGRRPSAAKSQKTNRVRRAQKK